MVDIYQEAKAVMQPGDIYHCGSDLYLRKNKISVNLVDQFEQVASVGEFIDQVDGDVWLRIWYAYN